MKAWGCGELQQKLPFSVGQMLKTGDGLSVDCDAFLEHGQRPDPEGAVAVVGAVDDEGLFRF